MTDQKKQQIPTDWKETTLGDVAEIIMGQSPDSESYNENCEGLPFYQGITEFGEKYVGIKTYTTQPTKIVEKNTVLFSVRAPVGKVNFVNWKCCIGRGNAGLRMKNGQQEFLFYLLKKIERNIQTFSSGTVFDSISGEELRNIEIVIPETDAEQRAIASVLSAFDDKIELLREQNKTLEAIAQTLFNRWFVEFNFPDENGQPYRDSGGKMIDSELGEIPEGWRVGGLIEDGISEFIKPGINEFEGVKDYVETANVNLSNFVGNFEKITYKERPDRANIQPIANSFYFARMAESRKYLLFQESDNHDIETKILSTGFAGIRCVKEYLYFYWCFILSDAFNNLKDQLAEGAVQIAISNRGIQKISLVLPIEEIARKFTEAIKPCFERISYNISQIQTLSQLRDTLLPKLMRGEVRVKGF